jgi:hypothetical protein
MSGGSVSSGGGSCRGGGGSGGDRIPSVLLRSIDESDGSGASAVVATSQRTGFGGVEQQLSRLGLSTGIRQQEQQLMTLPGARSPMTPPSIVNARSLARSVVDAASVDESSFTTSAVNAARADSCPAGSCGFRFQPAITVIAAAPASAYVADAPSPSLSLQSAVAVAGRSVGSPRDHSTLDSALIPRAGSGVSADPVISGAVALAAGRVMTSELRSDDAMRVDAVSSDNVLDLPEMIPPVSSLNSTW